MQCIFLVQQVNVKSKAMSVLYSRTTPYLGKPKALFCIQNLRNRVSRHAAGMLGYLKDFAALAMYFLFSFYFSVQRANLRISHPQE